MPVIVREAPKQIREESLDDLTRRSFVYLKEKLGGIDANKIMHAGERIADLQQRTIFYSKVVMQVDQELGSGKFQSQSLNEFGKWLREPVDIRTFLLDPYFLNKEEELYPVVLEEIIKINSGQYVELVAVGGIGSAKTTVALYTTAYQLYLLSCMRSPHRQFKLDPSSEIIFIFQSINKKLATEVDFTRFRSMIHGCQYFRENFPFDKNLESKLVFPNRIHVVPVSGGETAAIGQNVIGGLIDELNYMAVVEKSKQSSDKGTYDQAVTLYNSIARRRKSRFMAQGALPGILCLVSSRKYPGQFTDVKEAEAKKDPTIYVYDKRVWEIKPEGTFTLGFFSVFQGDLTRKPRILLDDEIVPDEDRSLVVQVPREYYSDFVKDVTNALREIAGLSTLARHPYFAEVGRVNACFKKQQMSIFTEDVTDFSTKLGIRGNLFYKPHLPRFVHIDLGLSGDSAGVAIGCVDGFAEMGALGRGEDTGYMPHFHIDGVLEVRAPKNSEIQFYKIRELMTGLRTMGLAIRWVTYDSFESTDSQQLLRQQGFITGTQSVDIVPCKPYDFLKSAMYDQRLDMPIHPHLQKELVMLERDLKTGKIDHVPGQCFTGETRVALANGTCPTFKELSNTYGAGEVFHVYSIGPNGLCIEEAMNPRVTKQVTELVEVLLDNFQIVRCTPDHLFMTLNGEWVQAQNLTPDISIMPLYRSVDYKGGWTGYEKVWCPVKREKYLTHHLSVGKPKAGNHVHHKDENKSNNSPDNLVEMSDKDHAAHHGATSWTKKKQQAMREGHAKYYLDNGVDKQRQLMKQLWAEGKLGPSRKKCSIETCESKANARGLCDLHYQRARRAKTLPHRTSAQVNHRVLRVTFVEVENEPVYDLSVPKTENFALAAGVFVHNSKDCADGLAGVVYGLTMRRETWTSFGIPLTRIPDSVSSVKDKLTEKNDRMTATQESLEGVVNTDELSHSEKTRMRVPR